MWDKDRKGAQLIGATEIDLENRIFSQDRPNSYHLPTIIYHPCLLSSTSQLLPPNIYLLPPTIYLLPTTYYLLPTAYYLLPTTYYLPASAYLLPPTYCLLLPPTA